MPGRISELDTLATPAAEDLVEVLDVSDLSMAPTGTNKRSPVSSLVPLATPADAIAGTSPSTAVTPAALYATHRAEDIRSHGGSTTASGDTNSAALTAALATGKNEIVLGEGGTYDFKNPAAFPDYATIAGHGEYISTMRLTADSTNGFVTSRFTTSRDVGFDGGGAPITTLRAYNAQRFTAADILVTNSGANGLVCDGSDGSGISGQIVNLRVRNCVGTGLHLGTHASDWKVVTAEISGCAKGLVCVYGAENLVNIHVWSNGTGAEMGGGDTSRIINLFCDTNTGVGLLVTGPRGLLLAGGHFWRNGGGGMVVNGGQYIGMSNFLVQDNTGVGVLFNNVTAWQLSQARCWCDDTPKAQTIGVQTTGSSDIGFLSDVVAFDSQHTVQGVSLVGTRNYRSNVVTTSTRGSGLWADGTLGVAGPPATARTVQFSTNDLARWQWRASNDAEAGANAGSTLQLRSMDDAGAFLSNVIQIARATGISTWAAAMNIVNATGSGYLGLVEQSPDPAAPAANGARLFLKDNGSGKTQLCVRFATGAVQVVATEP